MVEKYTLRMDYIKEKATLKKVEVDETLLQPPVNKNNEDNLFKL